MEVPGFAIYGDPRTKKNSPRIVTIPTKGARRCHVCGHMQGFPRVLPSEAYERWEMDALKQLIGITHKLGVELPIISPVSIEAHVYLEPRADGKLRHDCGDIVGYLQGIGDMLEKGGILANDRQIEDWDGSRRHVDDGKGPRVEIYITVLAEVPRQEALCL